jgi:phage tail-like protein
MAGITAVTQTGSLANQATDPLRNFKFQVNILGDDIVPGIAALGFMSATGLGITTEIIPYRQGGDNTTTRKLPGQSDFAPLTLTKGLMVGQGQMFTWMKRLFSVIQGQGGGNPGADFRADIEVLVIDHPVTTPTAPVKAAFKFHRAWPTSVSFSDLDAGSNAIIVNQLVLAHEGFDFTLADSGANGLPGTNSAAGFSW